MKIEEITEDMVCFDDGTTVESFHERDCCECDWADFSVLATYNLDPLTGKNIDIHDIEFAPMLKDSIALVKDAGFKLVATNGAKFFVPCYCENNGYYSENLTLIIKKASKKKKIDISECQEWVPAERYCQLDD